MVDMYEDDDQYDPGVDGDDTATLSPMQMMMGAMFGTVTPEGKAQATKVFNDLYNQRSGYDEQAASDYNDYEQKASEARAILQKARAQLAAQQVPTTKWLELAKGFGSPTRTGAFGESIANYATARIPGKQAEQQWEQNRTRDLLGYDQGVNQIDQALALQKLRMRQMRAAANDKLMVEAMKVMGKPTPLRNPPRTEQDRVNTALDEKYIPQFLEWEQKDKQEIASQLRLLNNSRLRLLGQTLDPKTGKIVQGKRQDYLSGPLVSVLPKMLRDRIPGIRKGSEIQENVEQAVQSTMRQVMGPQFTENEGVRLLARAYNPAFEEDVNARRVGWIMDKLGQVAQEKEALASYFRQHKTLRGYTGKTSWGESDFAFPPELGGDSKEDEAWMQKLFGSPVAPAPAPTAPAPTQAAPPAQGQEPFKPDYEWEWGEPARARGGRVGFAEGGQVRSLPDGRNAYMMPDGKWMGTPPGISYEQAVQRWSEMTGETAPRPGLPPQALPDPDTGADRSPQDQVQAPVAVPTQPPQAPAARPPLMEAQGPDPQEESFTQRVMQELPAALGVSAAGAAGAGTGALLARRAMETKPQQRLVQLMKEAGTDPSRVAAATRNSQRLGVPGMVMDDPALRPSADYALERSGGPQAQEVLSRLRARADKAGERVEDHINKGLAPDEYFDKLDSLNDALYTNAAPMYDAAYAKNPAVKSKVLYQLLDTPDGKKAVKTALRLMRNSGKKIGKADAIGLVQNPSLEFLDNVKRGFDQIIAKEEKNGPTTLGRSMRGLRNALREELDRATSSDGGLYAKARAQYEGDLEVRDALMAGRENFTKMQPRELQKAWDNMSFSAKDAYRSGVAQKMFEMINDPSTDTNFAKKIVGSPNMSAKLRIIFDSPKKFELFRTALEKEADLHEADRASIRKGAQGVASHAEPPPSLAQKAVRKIPNLLGFKNPLFWVVHAMRSDTGPEEKQVDDMLKYLKSASPEELRNFEKVMGSRMAWRSGRVGKVAAAGAGAAALARAALSASDENNEESDDAE